MTRLNVYAGPAGFYTPARWADGRRGGDARHRCAGGAARPGSPRDRRLSLDQAYREIALAIQDRSFTEDGRSSTPTRAPSSTASRALRPGHRHLTHVEPRVLRQHHHRQRCHVAATSRSSRGATGSGSSTGASRGSSSSTSATSRASAPGRSGARGLPRQARRPRPWSTGSSGTGGTGRPHRRLHRRAGGDHVLRNVGPDEPFSGGSSARTSSRGDPATTGQVMQFGVGPARGATPRHLRGTSCSRPARRCRRGRPEPLALVEEMSMDFDDAPAGSSAGHRVG